MLFGDFGVSQNSSLKHDGLPRTTHRPILTTISLEPPADHFIGPRKSTGCGNGQGFPICFSIMRVENTWNKQALHTRRNLKPEFTFLISCPRT